MADHQNNSKFVKLAPMTYNSTYRYLIMAYDVQKSEKSHFKI